MATKKKKKTKKQSLLGALIKWGFVLGIWGVLIVGGITAWYGAELPKITKSAEFARKSTITILSADGQTISRYGDLTGETVNTLTLPEHLVHAVIATEDRRFYTHFGIDPVGISRALVMNVIGGGVRQGGSTITQQLAKNLFLSHERTLKRKIQEALLALWLEQQLTKDEILSAYLNRVYLGSGTYGVDAAAKLYFGKPASDVNLLEAATIAGLLKAPSRYSPHNNPDLAYKRAQVVLGAMQAAGYITAEEADNAGTIMAVGTIPTAPVRRRSARYFTDWVIGGLDELIGATDENLVVQTTLNMGLQQLAEATLEQTIAAHQEASNVTQGAILSIQPDGAVVAMVGGRNYATSQFNRTTQARRQPGSAFKPILYLTALEQGWQPDSILLDEAFEEDAEYNPTNYKEEFLGEVTLTQALALSLNTPAVRLMQDIKPRNVIKTARKLGIFSPLDNDLSLALGSSALSVAELTTAYATLANQGFAVYPYAITKISNEDGELYYTRPKRTRSKRIIERETTQTLTEMLQIAVEQGTGKAAYIDGEQIAGKTGTSQDYRDAWFIGYTDALVTSIWLGNDDNTPMNNITGGSLPARMWRTIMAENTKTFDPVNRSDFSTGGLKDLLERLMSGGDTPAEDTQFND